MNRTVLRKINFVNVKNIIVGEVKVKVNLMEDGCAYFATNELHSYTFYHDTAQQEGVLYYGV